MQALVHWLDEMIVDLIVMCHEIDPGRRNISDICIGIICSTAWS